MAKYLSTKTYGTDRGLSCCFRQWRAMHSHCSLIHGYSIGIKLIFESETLDDKNWVMDFGGLKQFKNWADSMFDHTLVVAEDDPMLDRFKIMSGWSLNLEYDNDPIKVQQSPHPNLGICDLRIVPGVGCEMFAKLCYDKMASLLDTFKEFPEEGRYPVNPMVRLRSAEVFEHAGNSAIYEG
jgi:6-pyruvoyltetrahydropterin/6-carboxytetrahydropterin synthase